MDPLENENNQYDRMKEETCGHPLTSTLCALRSDLQTTLVDEVQSLDSVPPLYDTRDVDLVRALTDHLDVHVSLSERREHPARNAHQMAHLLPDERQNGHVARDRHL